MKTKRELNIIALVSLSCLGFKITTDFMNDELINYGIIAGAITLVMVALTVSYILKTRSDKAIYKNFIKSTLKTYDAVLVNSEELPGLKGKNIVRVNKFSDLIDAQIEMKKPIYYKEFKDYTVFILLDNAEACVSIVRLNDQTPCEYLNVIEEAIKSNLVSDIDKSLLEDIEKTTIIRLDNAKEFRVSPIRKEKSNELTPKKYYIRKNNIYCTLSDDTERRILLKDVKSFIKVFDNDNVLRNIVITTDEYKFILKDTSDMDLEEVETRLIEKFHKVNNELKIKIEYQEN